MSEWFSKWVWKDWLSDPAVHTSSLAAQGLWMQMLCLAALHDPPGYVALNGAKVDEVALLAKVTGTPPDEVKLLLSELEHNHVFSRNKIGTIYNRRMLKNENRARIARENGKLGGNPNLCKHKDIKKPDNLNPTDGLSLARAKLLVIKDSNNKDPTRLNLLPVSEKQAKPKISKKRKEYPADFEAFWTAYPTDANMPKAKTFAAWQALDGEDRKASIAAIPAFKAYCAAHKDYRPIYAERYLSQRRFDGHLQTAKKITSAAGFFAKRDSPQWEAWSKWWRDHKGKSPPGGNGWNFPTEWPPNGNSS